MAAITATEIKLLLDLALTLGAVVAMSYAAWRFVLPLFNAMHNIIQRIEATVDAVLGTRDRPGMTEQLEELHRQINSVVREVRPNGGASMNDAVTVVRGELRALLDADIRTARWSADRAGMLTWASKAYLRWSGATPDQLRDHGWLSRIHPTDREYVREEWISAIAEKRGSSFAFRLSDSHHQWMRVHGEATPILNSAGNVTGWLGTLNVVDEGITP